MLIDGGASLAAGEDSDKRKDLARDIRRSKARLLLRLESDASIANTFDSDSILTWEMGDNWGLVILFSLRFSCSVVSPPVDDSVTSFCDRLIWMVGFGKEVSD